MVWRCLLFLGVLIVVLVGFVGCWVWYLFIGLLCFVFGFGLFVGFDCLVLFAC